MSAVVKLRDIKCYRCSHTRSSHRVHRSDGPCSEWTDSGNGHCDCGSYVDPNLHLILGEPVSGTADNYKAAFARQQLTAAQKRGRLIPLLTSLWSLQWVLALAMVLLGIWTAEHWQFIWTGIALFIGGGVSGIVRGILWDANKGAIIQAHDSY